MNSAGIALVALGIGSLWMRSRDQQYVFLEWAEPLQPALGGAMVLVGAVLLLMGAVGGRTGAGG